MKKILVFFIIFGIFIGIVIGVSNEINIQSVDETEENLADTQIVPKLRLPISAIDTYNPLNTKNEHVSDVLKLIYEPLFELDEESQISPCLALEYFKRGDNSWVVRVKSGIEWHDGRPFSAADVVYTISYLLNEETQSVYKANVRNVLFVEQLDEETIVLTLKEEDAYIISKLTFPIISKNSTATVDDVLALTPQSLVGTGKYKFEQEKENIIKLVLNEKRIDKNEAKLKEIELVKYGTYAEAVKGFKSTEVDMIVTDMHTWKEKFGFIGINSFSYESSLYEVLIPNTTNFALKESSVRKAILHAINRPNIVSNIYEENATIKDIPIPSYSKYKTTSTEHDLEKAKQILVNAGWENNNNVWKKNNKILSFNLLVSEDNHEQILVAEKIKNDLQELNIKINIKKSTWEDFVKALEESKYDLAITTIDMKNEYQLQEMVSQDNPRNYANYTGVAINESISSLKNSQNEAYEEQMKSFIQTYLNELPYIGLYFKNNTILSNKSVKGEYKSVSSNPYNNITNFYK